MTWGAVAIGGATIVSSYMGGRQQERAQREANKQNVQISADQSAEGARQFDVSQAQRELEFDVSQTQRAGEVAEGARRFDISQAQRGLDIERSMESESERRSREDEINRQLQEKFDVLRGENIGAMSPYAEAGQGALVEQQALMGLGGQEAQDAAMARFSESPGQRFLRERQEKALLRNQSAIGGLGGGNVRTALQEQAFGRAQTQLGERMAQLSALSASGQQAASAGLQAGYGPGRVLTGETRGISTETPYGANVPSYQPVPTAAPSRPTPSTFSPQPVAESDGQRVARIGLVNYLKQNKA